MSVGLNKLWENNLPPNSLYTCEKKTGSCEPDSFDIHDVQLSSIDKGCHRDVIKTWCHTCKKLVLAWILGVYKGYWHKCKVMTSLCHTCVSVSYYEPQTHAITHT